MKTYMIDKETCQERIIKSGCVCDGCGGVLEPIETVDNSDNPTFWAGCNSCSKYTYGCKPDIYQVAKDMVINQGYWAYSHLGTPYGKVGDELIYWQRSQISGTVSVVNQVLQTQSKLQQHETPTAQG